MSRCVVTRVIPGQALDRLAAEHEVEVWPEPLPPTPAELIEFVRGADALVALLTERIDTAVLDAAPDLRIVANYAVGYDNIDIPEATRRGIVVTNTPDVLTDATADLAFALMVSAARHVSEADRYVREGRWRTWETSEFLGIDLRRSSVGVIGMGRIGSAFADRARGYGMDVRTVGRADRATLTAMITDCDIVSLHCPLTAETRDLIDADVLAAMKPGAILVNTARGGLVDLVAVADALERGRLGSVGIDVADQEPIPMDHPILRAPRTTITPHIGSATRQARERMGDVAIDNVLAVLRGDAPLTPVTPALPATEDSPQPS